MIEKITDLSFRFVAIAICGFCIGTLTVGIIFAAANLFGLALGL